MIREGRDEKDGPLHARLRRRFRGDVERLGKRIQRGDYGTRLGLVSSQGVQKVAGCPVQGNQSIGRDQAHIVPTPLREVVGRIAGARRSPVAQGLDDLVAARNGVDIAGGEDRPRIEGNHELSAGLAFLE